MYIYFKYIYIYIYSRLAKHNNSSNIFYSFCLVSKVVHMYTSTFQPRRKLIFVSREYYKIWRVLKVLSKKKMTLMYTETEFPML